MLTFLRLGIDASGAKRGADEAADAMRRVKAAAGDTGSAMDMLMTQIKIAAGAFGLFKIQSWLTEAAMLNARYETLGVAMRVVGRNAGYSGQEMEAFTAKLTAQGISMLEARNNITRMASANMDLTKSSQLARIAQDAAVIANINSSEAFERMVYAIQSAQPEMLRTMGMNVNFENSYKAMATALGKKTAALSENEKMQARVNAVIQFGTKVSGAYEEAMGTAGKQINSTKRYLEDLKVQVGDVFNEALTIGVFTFSDALKKADGKAKEMAADDTLRNWGRGIIEVFAFLIDAGRNVVNFFGQVGNSIARLMAEVKFFAQFANPLHVAKLAVSPEARQQMAQEYKELQNIRQQFRGDTAAWLEGGDRARKEAESFFRKQDADRIARKKRDKDKGTGGGGGGGGDTTTGSGLSNDEMRRQDLYRADIMKRIEGFTMDSMAVEENELRRKGQALKINPKELDTLIGKWKEAMAFRAKLDAQLKNESDFRQEEEAEMRVKADLIKQENDSYAQLLQTGRDRIVQIRQETEEYGMGARELAKFRDIRALDLLIVKASIGATADLKNKLATLREELAGGIAKAYTEVNAKQDSWMAGAKAGFQDYIDRAKDVAGQVRSAFGKTFSALEDSIVSFIKTGKFNFRSFAQVVVEEFLRIQIRILMMKAMTAVGFADGGVMTGSGPMPLKKYASGGIANSPQLAMFGEGSTPEAYVPLPDGRRIPVNMQGGGGGATTVNVNIAGDATPVVQGEGAAAVKLQFAQSIAKAVQSELVRQKRPGGLLAGAT